MTQGPFLTSALLCEQVIEGKDGVLSAIRIIDTVNLERLPAGQPVPVPAEGRLGPLLVTFTLLVTLKSGDFRGRGKVRFTLAAPSGKELPGRSVELDFFGEEKGSNLIFRGGFVPQEDGVYWFSVYFEDRLLSRSPLSVRFVASDSQRTTSDTAQQDRGDKK